MPTQKKAETIEGLTELIGRSKLAVAADYRGLKVADLTALRRGVRNANVEVHIVKNTLARQAATAANKPALLDLLNGPTALALAFGDQVEAAKALTDYLRTSRLNFPLKGAELDGRTVGTEVLNSLALLPPRNVLLAMVLGTMQAPIAGLATVLNEIIAGFVRVIDQRAKQLAS